MASITRTANPAGVSAASNVATYSTVDIGAAASNRIIVVVVASELASSTPSGCTIDYGSGDTAMTAGTGGNFGAVYAQTYRLLVPTGTTATIKVTYSATNPTSTQNHISVYRILDAVYSSAGGDGSSDMDATDPLTTGSITIPTGGVFLAVAGGATDTVAKTWANATEDLDVDAGAFRFTTATRATALTTTAVTCTGGTNGEDGALSWLIFADNTEPTVALNSPADAATGVSTTPVLDFTGTDPESNDVRYNIQIYKEVATDDFNRADNSSTGMNLGANWTASVPQSDLGINSNQAYETVGGGNDNVAFWSANTFANNQYSKVTLANATGSPYVIVRASATDYVLGQFNGTNYKIYWYNSGAYTEIATGAGSITNGDILELQAVGTTFSLYKNGVLAISGTNASAPSSGKPGIGIDDGSTRLDNWSGGDIVVDAVSGTDAGFANPDNTTTDDFNRADENPIGGNWTNDALAEGSNNQLKIVSNQLQAVTSATSCEAYWNANTFSGTTNLEQHITVVTKPGNANRFEMGFIKDPGTATYDGYDALFYDNAGTDTITIRRQDNASATILATINVEYSNGDDFSFIRTSSGVFIVLRNGVEILRTAADTTYTGDFYAYVGIRDTTAVLDDWGVRDIDPFFSGDNIQYTVQSALSNSTVYYWRVRAIDPSGSNTYGAWSTTRSFTATAGGGTVVQDIIGGFGFIPFAR